MPPTSSALRRGCWGSSTISTNSSDLSPPIRSGFGKSAWAVGVAADLDNLFLLDSEDLIDAFGGRRPRSIGLPGNAEWWRTKRSIAPASSRRAASRSSLAWRRGWPRSGRSGSEVDIGVSLLRLRSAAQAEEEATAKLWSDSEVGSILPADPLAPSSAALVVVACDGSAHTADAAAQCPDGFGHHASGFSDSLSAASAP